MKNLITFSLIAIPQICLGCILGTISKRLSITQRNYVLIILSIPIIYLHKLVLHIHWPLRTPRAAYNFPHTLLLKWPSLAYKQWTLTKRWACTSRCHDREVCLLLLEEPDLTCDAHQVPIPLWASPLTLGDLTFRTIAGIPSHQLLKMSAMILIFCPPFLPPYISPFPPSFSFWFLFFSPDIFNFFFPCSSCYTSPIMVNIIIVTVLLSWDGQR